MDLKTLRKKMNFDKKEDFRNDSTSEVDIAYRLIYDLAVLYSKKDPVFPVVCNNRFYLYNPDLGIWEVVEKVLLMAIIMCYSAVGVWRIGKKGEKIDCGFLKLSHNKIKDVFGCLMTHPDCLDLRFFDDSIKGIAFKNCFVKVTKDGVEVENHSHKHRAIACLDYLYDEYAVAEEWTKLLVRLFDGDSDCVEKRSVLQEFVGACLCGIATDFDKCLVLVGDGGNGKSTLQAAITENLFPSEAIGRVAPQRWGIDHYLSGLGDKLINAVPEMPKSRILSSDIFKAVVSGDIVQARDLFHDPYNFKAKAGHLLSCNELPGTVDYSNAFWDRFLVVKFNRNFRNLPASERVNRPTLLKRFKQEGPGIMNWTLDGAVRLLSRNEYTLPACNDTEKDEWSKSVDSVAAFNDECVTDYQNGNNPPKKSERPTPTIVYTHYQEWCTRGGRKSVSMSTFIKRFKRLGRVSIRMNNYRYYNFALGFQNVLSETERREIDGLPEDPDIIKLIKKNTVQKGDGVTAW